MNIKCQYLLKNRIANIAICLILLMSCTDRKNDKPKTNNQGEYVLIIHSEEGGEIKLDSPSYICIGIRKIGEIIDYKSKGDSLYAEYKFIKQIEPMDWELVNTFSICLPKQEEYLFFSLGEHQKNNFFNGKKGEYLAKIDYLNSFEYFDNLTPYTPQIDSIRLNDSITIEEMKAKIYNFSNKVDDVTNSIKR